MNLEPRVPIVIFAASAAFIFYVLAGYPLCLEWRARRRPRPVRKAPVQASVTIVLPVWNGERWLHRKMDSILRLDYPAKLLQVIVVSDGSTDHTDAIAREFADRGVELIRIPHQGKAAALNAGIERARGEIVLFTDVRQPMDPSSLRVLLECFADDSVGVVSGELVILEGDRREEIDVGMYWRYEKWIRKRQSRVDSVLGATGCLYAMRRHLIRPLPPNTLVDDVYLPLSAFFQGYRIILEDRAKAFDRPARLGVEFRRKVRTLAGVYQVIGAYPKLLTFSNRMWVDFISHKLGRLLLPYALAALAVSGFWLPGICKHVVAAAQALFYSLAILDLMVPQTWPLKRLSSPARTFVTLMAAALLAAGAIFYPGGRLWTQTHVREEGDVF